MVRVLFYQRNQIINRVVFRLDPFEVADVLIMPRNGLFDLFYVHSSKFEEAVILPFQRQQAINDLARETVSIYLSGCAANDRIRWNVLNHRRMNRDNGMVTNCAARLQKRPPTNPDVITDLGDRTIVKRGNLHLSHATNALRICSPALEVFSEGGS